MKENSKISPLFFQKRKLKQGKNYELFAQRFCTQGLLRFTQE